MVTSTQVAFIAGLPTACMILALIVQTVFYRKWMLIMREGTARSEAALQASIERHKEWERDREKWQQQKL